MLKHTKLKLALAISGALLAFGASNANATFMPNGVQSGIAVAAVQSWGWTQCSGGNYGTTFSSLMANCNGDNVMVGVLSNATTFGILGAGAYSNVFAVTDANHYSDNSGRILNNWSNGLNWYRTAGYGSFGFTTNNVTDLWSADGFLQNGIQALSWDSSVPFGEGGDLTKGLSLHTDGTTLTGGWTYNTTGNDQTYVDNANIRFFMMNNPIVVDVPEPTSIALLGMGALGFAASRRKK